MNKYRNRLNTKFIKVRKKEGHSFVFNYVSLWFMGKFLMKIETNKLQTEKTAPQNDVAKKF